MEDLVQVKKIRIEQSIVTETTEDEGSVELGLDANDEQEDEPGFMSDTSEGTVEDQVCGDVSDVHTISNNLDFHGQNLAVDNEAIEDLSPLVDTASETVETEAKSVTADAEFDVDAESVAGAENTESVAGSVGGYMETGSVGDVNTTVTGDAETESVGSDVTDDAEADSIGSDTEAESVGGEMDTESVEDAAETKSLAGDFDPESSNNNSLL